MPAARGVSAGSSGVPAGPEANRARRARPGAPRPPGQVRVGPGGGLRPRREAGRGLGLSRAAAYGATPWSPGGLPGSARARAGGARRCHPARATARRAAVRRGAACPCDLAHPCHRPRAESGSSSVSGRRASSLSPASGWTTAPDRTRTNLWPRLQGTCGPGTEQGDSRAPTPGGRGTWRRRQTRTQRALCQPVRNRKETPRSSLCYN